MIKIRKLFSGNLPFILFFGFVLLLGVSRVMRAEYGRDEDQFIASARLLLDHGLLPYRDYPYYHLPYLTILYALLFRLAGEYNLLAARLFSMLSAMVAVTLLFLMTWRFFCQQSLALKWIAAGGSVLFLLANPLFAATSGMAWNHDLSVLCTLGAACLCFEALSHQRSLWCLFVSGVLLGLAVGTRSSLLTALPAFLVALIFSNSWVDSLKEQAAIVGSWKVQNLVFSFLAGFVLILLPLLFFFAISPQQFIFGNWIYPGLNTLYRQIDPAYGPMDLPGKFNYLAVSVIAQPANLILLVAWLFFGVLSVFRLLRTRDVRSLLLFLLPFFVAIGSFLPTPSWYQYFYAPVPFMLLAISYGLSKLIKQDGSGARQFLVLFTLMVAFVNLIHWQDYRRISFLRYPETWRPLSIHRMGQQIAEAASGGPVLTFGPLFPLEGGAEIYPAFATGMFNWRTADLLPPEQRQQVGAVGPDELSSLLQDSPPAAILVGINADLEVLLVTYAQQNNYRLYQLTPRFGLWVRE